MSFRALFPASLACAVACALAGACQTQVPVGKKTPPPSEEPPHFYADPPFGVGFQCVTIGCDSEKSLVISNKGAGKLGISKVRLSLDSSSDFSLSRKDGEPLPSPDNIVVLGAGETLELLVRYRPSDGVLDAGSVEMEHEDAATAYLDSQPKTDAVPLTARAFGAPAATLPSQTLDFGYVPLGSEATLQLEVDNTGEQEVLSVGPCTRADGTSPAFHAPSPREWGTHFANPGESVTLPVVFSPSSADAFFGSVLLATNDPALPGVRVAVQGTAIAEPRLAVVSPTGTLLMPAMRSGESRTEAIVVQNLGGAPLDVNAAVSAGADQGLVVDPPSVAGLLPLATATFNVTYTAPGGGSFDGAVALSDAAGNTTTVPVHADVNAPLLDATPGSVQFGGIVQGWDAPPQAVSIANVGFGDLTITGIAFDVGASQELQLVDVPGLPVKLTPGQPPISVTVLMQAFNIGPVDGTLLITSDSIDGGVTRVPIHGDVITCAQGCPVAHGSPNCDSGTCQIGSCDGGFHDANQVEGDGCECREDLDPFNNPSDISAACPGRSLGSIGDNDNPTSVTVSGTLHSQNDIDLLFVHAIDQNDICIPFTGVGENYKVFVDLTSGPPGLQLCVNFEGKNAGCGGVPTNCSSRHYDGGGGSCGGDDSQDVVAWVQWAPDAAPQCGSWTVRISADNN